MLPFVQFKGEGQGAERKFGSALSTRAVEQLLAHPVRKQRTNLGRASMEDAKYFRAQAELSLEIARQLSDPLAANRVRLTAADFLAKAEQLERTGHNGVAIDRGSQPPDPQRGDFS